MKSGTVRNPVYIGPYHLRGFAMFPEDTRNMWDHVHVNVLSPEYVEVFVSPKATNVEAVFGKLKTHRIDVHKRIDIAIEYDNAGCNVAGGEFGWTIARAGATFTRPN
jgi:hypothetical protein